MKRRSKGSTTASMVLFVTSGILASTLGVRQYDRATTEMGWVTKATLHAGQVITADFLTQDKVKQDAVGIANPREIIGKKLKVTKQAGETFRAQDFAPPQQRPSSTLAQRVPEGRVLYTLQLGSNGSVPFSQLTGGDRLDILVRGQYGVRTAATDVQLVGLMKSGGGKAAGANNPGKITSLMPRKEPQNSGGGGDTTLVLAVLPEHVYPLAHISARDTVSLVLHSAYDVAAGNAVTVTPSKTEKPVEVMAGLNRSTVFVKR